VRQKHRETVSHLNRPVSAVSSAYWQPTISSHVTVCDPALGTPPTNVDEALAEIECQRELIGELTRCGQPTRAAEMALNGMLREFASMIEYECGMLSEGLRIRRSA
jgi:hypothetical protein